VISQQFGNIISGIGLHTKNLVDYLSSDGHYVTLITPQNQIPNSVNQLNIIAVPNSIFNNYQARWLPLSIQFARELKNLEKKDKFDIFQFTDARETMFFNSNTPIIGNVNDTYSMNLKNLNYYRKYYQDWFYRWLYYLFVRNCEKYTFPRMKALITNSYFTKKMVMEKYHIDQSKIFTIHKSINIKEFENIPYIKSQNHPPRILFIGGNMQRKGLPTLIEAAPLIKKYNPHVEFWIVGKDKAESKMKILAKKWGVYDSFQFLGWKDRNQLLQIYSQASIFTLPSITEAFGVVILEAMAAGLPVVATNVGGIPEIINSGENGITIPPGNSNELANAIINILDNENLRVKLIENAFSTVKIFDVHRMMDETYQVYRTILNVND